MPNTKGGKNYKKNKQGAGKMSGKKTKTPYADSPELLYAQVKSKLGGDRISVECSDGVDRQAIIPGSFYKRVWINKSDVLLIQMNELKTTEAYILYKYDPNEAHTLKNKGLLKFDLGNVQDDDVIQFGYDNKSDNDEEEDDDDEVQAEVDKKTQEQRNKTVIAKKADLVSDEESSLDKKIDKKIKVKTENVKRQNDRTNKYIKEDGTINIDAI
jgi:translation initiation factor 1A